MVNVHLIAWSLLPIVPATTKMLEVKTVMVGTVRKWKSCALTTSVARTVTDIRMTAIVLATKMHLKKKIQVMINPNDGVLWLSI